MLSLEQWSYFIGIIIGVGIISAGVGKVMVWSYRHARRVEHILEFVERLETNHLNHIYERLGRIERHLGIQEDGDGQNTVSDAGAGRADSQ